MNRTGGSIGQQFSLIADGFYNTYAEIAAGPTQYGTLQPGDVRFRDINGDGVINDYDIAPFGFSDVPEITGSFQVGLSYKNFDLTVMFQGANCDLSSYEQFFRLQSEQLQIIFNVFV